MAQTAYGDITPRTAAYAAKELLKRGLPYLVFEKFGQAKTQPSNSTTVQKFRRYTALPLATTGLTEGVTPVGQTLAKTDITATLAQYGDKITVSDVILDTHEDPVLNESITLLGEQAAQTIEAMRFGVLKANVNPIFANGTTRSAVNTAFTLALQRTAVRNLKRNNARPITTIVRSTPSFGTENVAPGYVCVCHPDLEGGIRGLTGFTPAEKYGTITPWENEIGKIDDVRYLTSTICAAYTADADKGGTVGLMVPNATTPANAAVYPMVFLGRDAYGIVALKGQYAVTPMVVNPTPSDSDPLAQRGHVSWKSMQTCVILNDKFMTIVETAALN
jgi:N4-gp56 family major capsid protein